VSSGEILPLPPYAIIPEAWTEFFVADIGGNPSQPLVTPPAGRAAKIHCVWASGYSSTGPAFGHIFGSVIGDLLDFGASRPLLADDAHAYQSYGFAFATPDVVMGTNEQLVAAFTTTGGTDVWKFGGSYRVV